MLIKIIIVSSSKEGCFEQGLVQNTEDSFVEVHLEEVESEFEVVLLWLASLANKLEHIEELLCLISLCCLQQ
jgi:hypothetical protein